MLRLQLLADRRAGVAPAQRLRRHYALQVQVVSFQPENHLIARADPELVTEGLRDDHLPFWPYPIGHTDQYNHRQWLLMIDDCRQSSRVSLFALSAVHQPASALASMFFRRV